MEGRITQKPSSSDKLDVQDRVDILMEEYRVLYSLVVLRLGSLDRRVPVAGGSLAAFLGSVTVLPLQAQVVFLTGLPFALIWFLRATINHARSAEDAFRRIDEIERHVNRLAGEELLAFQSRHPSRERAVGGRTSSETIRTVLGACLLVLAACLYLAYGFVDAPPSHRQAYAGYVIAIAAYLVACVWRLQRYRYRKQSSGDVLADSTGSL